MGKLIDADTCKEYLKRVLWGADIKIDNWVDSMPAVDAVPVVHGRWIKSEQFNLALECSECGAIVTMKPVNYCQFCGAKMDGAKGMRQTEQLPMANEEAEQIALMRWAAYQEKLYPALKKLFHIPNGGSRGKAEAGRFKLMGVKPGVPDLFLPEARGGYHGLYIELKRVHNGVVSAAQKGWIKTLRESGYRVEVCRGWVAASEVLKDYLKD